MLFRSSGQEIARTADSESKWKQLGELALSEGNLPLAEACMTRAKDTSGLLLLHTACGSGAGMASLAEQAKGLGKFNVAFLCLFLSGKLEDCVSLLVTAGRVPEAAFFARTYVPSKMSEVVALWRADLKKVNPKAAESLADPAEYPNLFPDLDVALRAEQHEAARLAQPLPAGQFMSMEGSNMQNLIEKMQEMGVNGSFSPAAVMTSPLQSAEAQEEEMEDAEEGEAEEQGEEEELEEGEEEELEEAEEDEEEQGGDEEDLDDDW